MPQGRLRPPVDSKLEISWGCLGTACGVKNNETFFNLSQVDGFTLPYAVTATGAGANCRNAACPTMNYATQCPSSENLSTANNFPNLKNQDLKVLDPVTKQSIGCFSPCGKLTFAKSFSGYQLPTNDPQTGFYSARCLWKLALTSTQCGVGSARRRWRWRSIIPRLPTRRIGWQA
jgi:hypothetical protein